jgi:hypothetical protein
VLIYVLIKLVHQTTTVRTEPVLKFDLLLKSFVNPIFGI